MKPSKLLVPLRRLSVARGSFIIASCVAAAAVALAVPQQSGSARAALPNKAAKGPNVPVADNDDARPASMKEFVHVMLEMDAPAAINIYAEAYQAALAQVNAEKQALGKIPFASAAKGVLPKIEIDSAATSRVQNQIMTIDNAQKSLLPAIANAGGEVIFRTQRVYNGIAVRVSPDHVAELAKMPGVKAVHAMSPKHPTAAFTDIDFLGTRTFWTKATSNGVGLHGEGVTVADIDTGLDYVHTNFGGPGTSAAYAATTDTAPFPNQYVDQNKVPFGYDFAGDAYTGSNTPHPDSNPMDTAGHGSGTASLIAGYGVNMGGTTYKGNYDATGPNMASMKISPGQAPLAKIVPLRVFGTSGSTNLVVEAIDYAMDPNGDGNFNDHVDVINMSLGADAQYPDDPDSVAASNAAAAGVIVCSAAGNAGDTYYVASSPASGTGTLSIAASFNDQSGFIADAQIKVNNTSAAGSRAEAIYGSPSPHVAGSQPDQGGLTGEVVQANPRTLASGSNGVNPSNCSQMNGYIVLVDRGGSTFLDKAQRIQSCGGKAAVISNQNNPGADPIVAALDSSIHIPVVMISQVDADNFRGVAQFDSTTGVSATHANVTIYNDNQVISHGSASAAPDTMTSYSSRGPTLGTNALKPDVTAPAEVVGVATQHTGNGVMLFNGTSSATPHVAGGMALARQLHPTWSVLELNALMMNTAIHDLYTSTSHSTRYGLGRVGAGRVDFGNVSKSDVVVFNSQDPSTVNVSFGNVEVPVNGSVAISKNVTIRNKGTTDITYNGTIDVVTSAGTGNNASAAGNFSAPSSQVLVRAGQEVTFPLLFRSTGSALQKTRDPSASNGQATAYGTFGREWLSEVGAYAVLTPTTSGAGATTIRIPLYALPKPVSSMHAATNQVTPTGTTGTMTIPLSGVGINNATTISLLKPLELQYVSPQAASAQAPNDADIIKYVGVSSDYSTYTSDKSPTTVTFGLEGFGEATLPTYYSSDKEIDIDLDNDGQADYVIYPAWLPISGGSGAALSNVYFDVLLNVHTGSAIYEYPTNLNTSDQLDVNAFNNSTLLMSVDARDLGYTGAGQSSFNYWVNTFDRYTGALKDQTPTMHYDLAKPGFDAANGNHEPFYFADLPSNLPVNYNGNNIQANKSLGVLLIHRQNGEGFRSDVVTLRTPVITSFTPDHGPAGTTVTVHGQNFDANTKVIFSPNVPATTRVLSDTAISTDVPQGAETGPITVTNGIGSSSSAEPFTVTPPPEPSPSPSPSPTVSPTGRNPVTARLRSAQ